MRQGRAASPGQHSGGAGSSVPVPPVHEAQAQDVVSAHQIVFFRQGIAAAGGTAQPGVQHAPPVLPAAGADGDAHRIVPPGGQAAAGILPGREVHVDQLHLHRGIHPAPGQRVPGGKLQSEQVPGRPAAGVGLVPGGTGSVQTGQHGVFRQEDGHIYWIPQFSNIKGEEKTCTHNDEAFWIQARVLEWANYPEIKTMDDYFKLIEDYNAANPTMEDGTENIPYTILCEDWRYFCLENAPQFLDGYPNDGSCMVDPDTLKVMDYNTSDTAVKYFKKLNEEYQKGIVDPESFTQTYDEYIAKLSSGRVLGMIDQWWDFAYSAGDAIKSAGLDAQGCDYIPVPVTIDGRKNQWHNSGGVLNSGDGLAITKDCDDVEAALQFVDDLLSEEIHNLRFWGVEGEDYQVGDDGLFYRTKEQRAKAAETDYKASHACSYSYFPQYDGTCDDGLNATKPSGQAKEFFDGLNEDVKKAFQAYGVETYVEMLGTNEAPGPWYPMWSFSNNFTTDTEGGMAWTKIGEVKHEQLPQVVMAKDFDSAWKTYMDAYNACNPDAFLSELQAELDKRMKDAAKYE